MFCFAHDKYKQPTRYARCQVGSKSGTLHTPQHSKSWSLRLVATQHNSSTFHIFSPLLPPASWGRKGAERGYAEELAVGWALAERLRAHHLWPGEQRRRAAGEHLGTCTPPASLGLRNTAPQRRWEGGCLAHTSRKPASCYPHPNLFHPPYQPQLSLAHTRLLLLAPGFALALCLLAAQFAPPRRPARRALWSHLCPGKTRLERDAPRLRGTQLARGPAPRRCRAWSRPLR